MRASLALSCAAAFAAAFVLSPAAHAQDVPGEAADDQVPVLQPRPTPDPNASQEPQRDPSTAVPTVGVATAGKRGFSLSADGRSRLHLGLDAGVGLDTNPYSVPLDNSAFTGDMVARVRPRMNADAPGSMLAFRGDLMLDYGFFPGLITGQTANWLLYQVLVMGDLEVNRGGMLKFAIGDTFSFNSDPGTVVIPSVFTRAQNEVRAGLGFSPGGALELRLGYAFGVTYFVDLYNNQPAVRAGVFDTHRHSAQFRFDYRFLPRTGIFGMASVGYSYYPSTDVNPDAFPVDATIGIQGQILSKLAGLLSLGYSNPLVVENGAIVTGNLFGMVAQGEVQWLPSPNTRMGIGYQRSFSPAPVYQFLGNNRFYGNVHQILAGKFVFDANLGYSILEFGEEQLDLTDQTSGRLDGHLDALLSFAYYFTDWLSLAISNNTDWRLTNANDLSTGSPINLSYVRNQTLLLGTVQY